jgi:hypothetical protein
MGYIWIISEYGGNKGGIRIKKNTPHFSNYFALVRGGNNLRYFFVFPNTF